MSLKVGVDFDGNGWVELHRASGDANNLFGADAANAWNLERSTAAGTITASEALTAMGPWNQPYYGRSGILLQAIDTNDRYAIGFNGTATYNITAQASGAYSACIWAKTAGGTMSARLRLKTSATPGSAVGPIYDLDDTAWYKMEVSGSLPYTNQSVFIEIEATTASSDACYFYGPMIVAGAALPEYLNCGTDGQHENISDYVQRAQWNTGFTQPYKLLAGAGRASFVLVNDDKRFSPEYASGPNFGNFVNDRLVQVADGDGNVLWTGFVDAWTPQHGTNYERMAALEASDGFKFITDTEIFPDLKTSAAPGTLILHVIDLVEASAETVLTFDGVKGSADNFNTPYTIDLTGLETETVPYYFDQTPNESDKQGQLPASLLEDILTGIQAKFWWTRWGFVDYNGPAEDGGAVAATFDNSAIGLDYQWGQNIVNECTVNAYPRQASGTLGTLWRLRETTFEVDAGATETIRAFYTDPDTGERCGADNTTVVLNGLTYSGAGLAASISDIDAMSAEIAVVSTAGVARQLTSARIQGNPLLVFDAIARTREDSTSIAANGRKGEKIDSRWVAKGKWAKRLAQFRVNRFKDARGEVVSLTGRYDIDSQFADCWIGRKINVADDQLEHDQDYIVIGEDHRWEIGDQHWTKLYLERTTTTKVSTTSV